MMKKQIIEIMGKNFFGVAPGTPVLQAVELMRSNRVSCLPVLEDSVPVGIFTERNLVRHMAQTGANLTDVPIRDLMSSPVLTVTKDMFLYEAFHVLSNNHIRHLVVVDSKGRGVGVVSFSNIMDQIGHELLIELQPISGLMTKVLFTVEQDVAVRDLLVEMSGRSISCVIYLENNKPIGILTERDIVSLAASKHDLASKGIRSVMKTPVVTVLENTLVHEAARTMHRERIRRVVVVDGNGEICGLATQSNIIQGLETKYVKILKLVLEEREKDLRVVKHERERLDFFLQGILESSMDMGIVATDDELRIIYQNDCASQLLGYNVEQAVGRTVKDIHQELGLNPERLEKCMDRVREKGAYCFEYKQENKGATKYFEVRVARVTRNGGGALSGFVHMVKDITDQKRAQENIRFMAYHDILTGLPNRVSFDERLRLELARAQRAETVLSVLIVDVDGFKQINDTYGHFAGDMLLRAVADRIKGALRQSDTVARIGGDEFVTILPDLSSKKDALMVAEKLVSAMKPPVDLKGEDVSVSLSIGLSYYPEHARSGSKLCELADLAMYEAKKLGKGEGGSHIQESQG